MKTKSQQIAIAGAVGITNIRPDPNGWGGGPDVQYVGESQKPFVGWLCCHTKIPRYSGRLPKYTEDLNAMHESEMWLKAETDKTNDGLYYVYAEILEQVAGHWEQTSATAAQRAEAFLRTLNLWDESK
jgi:hypothetical protein